MPSPAGEVPNHGRDHDFDPIFRLFTVIYGFALTYSLKPFADALMSRDLRAKLFAADWSGLLLLLAFVGFLFMDWFWAAAYLKDYWPTKHSRQSTHPFYKAFCDQNKWLRSMILFFHFGFTGSYALATYLAWSGSWEPFKYRTHILIYTSPLLWLIIALGFAALWDICMYVGELEVKPLTRLDRFLTVVYQWYSALSLLALIALLAMAVSLDTTTGLPHSIWLYRKSLVTWVLLIAITLRFLTYIRVRTIVKVDPPSGLQAQLHLFKERKRA